MKHIPIKKMSKKAQRKLHGEHRVTWGALNPVTRKPPNPKAYKRNKVHREDNTFGDEPF